MIKNGFTINECDKCVCTKTITNVYIIICLYVDMQKLGTNIEVIKFTKHMLSNNFDMKNLRIFDVILRIKITKTPDGSVYLNHYVDKMIARFKKYGIKENTNFFLLYIHFRKNTGTETR